MNLSLVSQKPSAATTLSVLAALRSAIAAQQTVAINAATARLNDATNDFASRRMDRNIRRALAGQKISDL